MKEINSLKKKLAQYSALAIGVSALAAEKAEGQITYHDVNPDEHIIGDYFLDMNNDSIFDFKFEFGDGVNGYCPWSFASVSVLGSNSVAMTSFGYVSALQLGSIIQETMPEQYWGIGELEFFDYACFGSSEACSNCSADGAWVSAFNKYVGIKLHLTDGVHFGWIRMTNGVVLKDYAYQSQPGIPIHAGEFDNCDTVNAQVLAASPCICTGILLTTSSDPYLIQWYKNDVPIVNAVNPSLSVNQVGDYKVVLYSYGCSDTSEAFAAAYCPGHFAPDISRNADTLISSAPYGNQWYDYTQYPIPGATDFKFIISQDGWYYLNMIDSFGCESPLSSFYALTCQTSFHVDLTNSPLTDTLCNSGSVLLNAYFISATSYQWFRNNDTIPAATFHNYSATESGEYFVIARKNDTGCCDTSSSYHLLVDTISVPIIQQAGDSLISSPAFMYQWFVNNQIIPGATNQIYFPTQSGAYQVQITDNNECSAVSDTILFIATEIDEVHSDAISILQLSNHQLNVAVDPSLFGSELMLYNMLGEIKTQAIAITNMTIIDIKDFDPGIYFLMLNKNEKQIVKKFFVL